MTSFCACCEGAQKLVPAAIYNRPGLDQIAYRIGTHGSFLETMIACIAQHQIDLAGHGEDSDFIGPLRDLTSRESDDPTLAFLDAWATLADLLTFYQERIANEGYLRTAVERRSVLEMAALIGYQPRPGVAATVYPAFTLEEGYTVDVPVGTRAQSIPGPGELPQPFETTAILSARTEWNVLLPRQRRPQRITLDNVASFRTLVLDGVNTGLAVGDPLLLSFADRPGAQALRRVAAMQPVSPADLSQAYTVVTLQADHASLEARVDREMLRRVVEHFSDLDAFNVSEGSMSRTILDQLHTMRTHLDSMSLPGIHAHLNEDLLPSLREDFRISERRGFGALVPWIRMLIEALGNSVPTPRAIAEIANENSLTERSLPDRAVARVSTLESLLERLAAPPSKQPVNRLNLQRSIAATFTDKSDTGPRLIAELLPAVLPTLYSALRVAEVVAPNSLQVYALRTTASLFGHAAAQKPLLFDRETGEVIVTGEWPVVDVVIEDSESTDETRIKHEEPDRIDLDTVHNDVVEDSWVVIETRDTSLTQERKVFAMTTGVVSELSRSDYGIAAKTTRIRLREPGGEEPVRWITADLDDVKPDDSNFAAIRQTVAHTRAELLPLADAVIDPVAEPVAGDRIELGRLYDGLDTGRWIIVSGKRLDIAGVDDVTGTERVMIAGIEHSADPDLPGDTLHTTLILANDLEYIYRRDTVTLYGNVTKATHGESVEEILGSGDGAASFQEFVLSHPDLTYTAAPVSAGVESSLRVRVNDVLWSEADNLPQLEATDHGYLTRTDNDQKTTVATGDGINGARLPSGLENVTSTYRHGIGKAGNVAAGQISLLATRPLGVKEVINPLPAVGGGDPESRDDARRNAPLAVAALDRLVAVRDYADFARTFAGIGKAKSTLLSDGRRRLVHVTYAGQDGTPIPEDSDLIENLRGAIQRAGGAGRPFVVAPHENMLLVASTNVKIDPDFLWEKVEPQIRAAVLEYFSFARRDLAQDALLSEFVSAIQGISGVIYVDVDVFDSLIVDDVISESLTALAEGLTVKDRIIVNAARLQEVPITHTVNRHETRASIERRYRLGRGVLQRLNGLAFNAQPTIGQNIVVGIQNKLAPAQLAVFSADQPDTLIFSEVKQ